MDNPTRLPCTRTRLAENHVAAVDICECGMMHLHLGPLSLRLTPDAIAILAETLALATGARLVRSSVPSPAFAGGAQPRRGEA